MPSHSYFKKANILQKLGPNHYGYALLQKGAIISIIACLPPRIYKSAGALLPFVGSGAGAQSVKVVYSPLKG